MANLTAVSLHHVHFTFTTVKSIHNWALISICNLVTCVFTDYQIMLELEAAGTWDELNCEYFDWVNGAMQTLLNCLMLLHLIKANLLPVISFLYSFTLREIHVSNQIYYKPFLCKEWNCNKPYFYSNKTEVCKIREK